MEGQYKTKLTEQQLIAVSQSAFGCSILSSIELSDGWANSAYSIELEDGRQVVLKARPPATTQFMRSEVDTMRTEVMAMSQLAGMEGLPIPRIYCYDDSLTIVPVEYYIMERLEGTPYNKVKGSLPEKERESIENQLGVMSRLINQVKGERFGFYLGTHHSSWKDAFREMIFGVLEDGEDAQVTLPISYSELQQKIELQLGVLDDVKEPQLVHWDLWDGNIFVKDGKITGIIDFERALWGDPLMEMYFGRFNPSPSFRQGYRLWLTEPSQQARRALYDLYLDLILFIECSYRKYENKEHIQWAYNNLVEGLEGFSKAS